MSVETGRQVRLAILPFRNLLTDQKVNPMLIGLDEELVIGLSKFVGLSVISHFSAFQLSHQSSQTDIDALHADYIVFGTLKEIGDSIRINIQLISERDKSTIFAQDYSVVLSQLIAIQDEIILQLVNVLQERINFDLLSFSYKKKAVEYRAYEYYLQGMEQLKKASLESDLEARKLFEKALEVDAQFAQAYTGLSLSYFNEWSCTLWERWEVSSNGAQKYALKAIEIDPDDYKALAVVGRTYLFTGEFEKAEHSVRKSLRMNPNDADNLIQIAFSLMYLGYPEESVSLYERAQALNPLHKNIYFAYASNFCFEAGLNEKAIELGLKVDMDLCWIDFPAYMAAAYFHAPDKPQMNEWWAEYIRRFEGHIYSGKGDITEEAIKWQQTINPYKNGTRLMAMWQMLGSGSDSHQSKLTSSSEDKTGVFEVKTNGCELGYDGENALVKCSKGLFDIISMIERPGEEIHCNELMGVAIPSQEGVEVLDEKSKIAYARKVEELKADIEDAEELQNFDALEKLHHEYDELVSFLSQSLGLQQKSRVVGSTVDKTRSAVTWRIRASLKKIEAVHPRLGKHLKNSITTGTYCSYSPEESIDWQILR